jgi:hypothetical protein
MSHFGCSMTGVVEALADSGTCHETMWPYVESYQEAKGHRITRETKLKRELNEMKACLAQGYPFAFGLRLYQSFDRGGRTVMVRLLKPPEPSRGKHGV